MLETTGERPMATQSKPSRPPQPKPRKSGDTPSRAFLTGGARKVEEHLVDGPEDSEEQQ
jgi:hypothetical protein